VGSAVVLLRGKTQRELRPDEEPAFAALVKAAFAHRRKTLVNSLKDEGYAQNNTVEILTSCGLSPTARAESISVIQFIELCRRFGSEHR
jgi:16S rRNA (adenine1518-N6/adenine1519-N6)-dimethyltransferase